MVVVWGRSGTDSYKWALAAVQHRGEVFEQNADFGRCAGRPAGQERVYWRSRSGQFRQHRHEISGRDGRSAGRVVSLSDAEAGARRLDHSITVREDQARRWRDLDAHAVSVQQPGPQTTIWSTEEDGLMPEQVFGRTRDAAPG